MNLEVAHDLKDLANMIDTFIKQQQVTLEAKQEKLSKCKSIDKLMEMSNLPQYNTAWGDRNNKKKSALVTWLQLSLRERCAEQVLMWGTWLTTLKSVKVNCHAC